VIAYVVLGLIQGLTEFLPVSSSGHLVLAERLFGLQPPGMVCEAALHLATLAAVVVAFRSDLVDLVRSLTPRGSVDRRKEIGLLILGTAPIVVAGLLVREAADTWFRSLWVVGAGWLATAAMLAAADRPRGRRGRPPTAAGAFESVWRRPLRSSRRARSGFTIGAGIAAGLHPSARRGSRSFSRFPRRWRERARLGTEPRVGCANGCTRHCRWGGGCVCCRNLALRALLALVTRRRRGPLCTGRSGGRGPRTGRRDWLLMQAR
jgi:hypothetical protein